MTDFTKTITGFRYVQTRYGDTLQKVALRELGDTAQWSKLVWFNGLVFPYLTDYSSEVKAGVLLTGSSIKVPASSARSDASVAADDVFKADCKLINGRLAISSGTISVVSGRENLSQALMNRMDTDQGELVFHPTYGTRIRQLIGQMGAPKSEIIGARFAREALALETRIQSINHVISTVTGDQLEIQAEVTPIAGTNVKISQVV